MASSSISPAQPDPAPVSAANQSLLSALLFTGFFFALHTLLWCVLAVYLAVYVPAAERDFRDYNMTVPTATLFAMSMSRWVYNYWYVLVLWLPFWFLIDGGILAFLYRRSRLLGWAWALLNTALPLLFLALAYFAIETPLAKLHEALSH